MPTSINFHSNFNASRHWRLSTSELDQVHYQLSRCAAKHNLRTSDFCYHRSIRRHNYEDPHNHYLRALLKSRRYLKWSYLLLYLFDYHNLYDLHYCNNHR